LPWQYTGNTPKVLILQGILSMGGYFYTVFTRFEKI